MKRFLSIAAIAAAATAAQAQTDSYWITFNLSSPLSNVFVYADEWNGQVYAWDLFPAAFGDVPAGRSTYPLGTRNIMAWSVLTSAGTAGVGAGINSSINPPDGRTFESVFPGYTIDVVRSNITTLFNGAYNTPQAFYLFEFALANEDTLKTDFPTGSLAMYTFSNVAAPVGTATISNALPCYPNCDASSAAPILNANDFQCFLNKFAAGDTYANCDGSSVAPILNANDFQCFLNSFAAGCP